MTTSELPTLLWNLVAKNIHPHEQLRKKLRQKISKLEKHLQHFPAGTVHLHVALEKHPRKPLFRVGLTLRVPANILCSERHAADPIPALDRAVKALLRELAGLKSELRREAVWKRRQRRAALHQAKAARFAEQPLPAGVGPQTLADSISALFQEHYRQLVAYVRRQLWRDETAGDIATGAVDPRAVVDEVARHCLAEPERKPADMSYPVWFYSLARKELRVCMKAVREQATQTVPLDEPRVLPHEAGRAEGYEPEQPLDILQEKLEPPVVETKDLLPDPRALPPDEEVARRDFIDYLQNASTSWPKVERDIFALHFLDGFDVDEVAMIEGLKPSEVERHIQTLQSRVREMIESAAVHRKPTRMAG